MTIKRERLRRPARPSRRAAGTNGSSLIGHAFPGEHEHAEMGLPPMTLKTAIEVAVGLLSKQRPIVLACVPANATPEPVSVDAEEMAELDIRPSLFGVVEMPDENELTTMFILRPVDGAPPQETHDAVLMMTLVPRVLKTLLSRVKPWHLGVIAPDLYPLPAKPSDEEIGVFSRNYAAALVAWGVFVADDPGKR